MQPSDAPSVGTANEPVSSPEHPYRPRPESGERPSAPPPAARKRRGTALAIGLVGVGAILGVRAMRRPAPAHVIDVAPQLARFTGSFPVTPTALEVAPPLDALLAADEPDSLSVLAPGEGSTSVRRGSSLRFRFNRPMVRASEVSRPLERIPLRFDPPLAGRAQWISRNTLEFTPDTALWPRGGSSQITLDRASLHSLGGEPLQDETERTLVLDTTPRANVGSIPRRMAVGGSVLLPFDGTVGPDDLQGALLAYELGGAPRPVGFTLAAAGVRDGQSLVRLTPTRVLDPGARMGIALSPSLTGSDSYQPEAFEVQVQPRPRVEGVACRANATSAGECDVQGDRPGRVLDIAESFTLVASHSLNAVTNANVTVEPPLPNMTVGLVARAVTVRGEWAAGRVYSVRFNGLTTSTGEPVPTTATLAVRSRGLAPDAHWAASEAGDPGVRRTFEHDARGALALSGVNIGRGTMRYVDVAPGEEAAVAFNTAISSAMAARAQTQQLRELLPDARENHWQRDQPVAWLDPARGHNATMALLELDPDGAALDDGVTRLGTLAPRTTLVQRTNLGVHARALADGVFVWVTQLDTAQPVRGANITLHAEGGSQLGSVTTDGDGVGFIALAAQSGASPNDRPRMAVLASQGDDRAVLLLDPATAISHGALGLAQRESAVASTAERQVYQWVTDRGLYRPGETVRAKLIARSVEGVHARAVRNTQYEVRWIPPGQEAAVWTSRRRSDAFGTIDAEVELASDSPRGDGRLQLWSVATAPVLLNETFVRVQRYRAPTFRVEAEGPQGPFVNGDSVPVHVRATYLFGAPLRDTSVSWHLADGAPVAPPARFAQYTFGNVGSPTPPTGVAEGTADLDAQGGADVPVRARTGWVTTELRLEATVRDASGEERTGTFTTRVYPATVRVGLANVDATAPLGTALEMRSIALDTHDAQVAGQSVTGTVTFRGWRRYWQGSGDAEPVERRVREQRVVHTCEMSSVAEGPARCAFTPTEAGEYELRVRTVDPQGRATEAAQVVYLAGPSDRATRDRPGSVVQLTPAQRRVTVGSRAQVTFECPFERAEALLLVEREGVIYRERRAVTRGGVTWDFPVSEQMVPNAFVSLVLTKPRTGAPSAAVDVHAPDLRLGATELTVRPVSDALTVRFDRETYTARAGTSQPVELTVRDGAGHPVSGTDVLVYAVDEGTLRLTNYRVPDIAEGLFPARGMRLAIEDLRRSLVSRVEAAHETAEFGDGDEAGEGDSAASSHDDRERAEPTVLWMPHVHTDAQGHARVQVRLPDRPTGYRLMAVAVDRGSRVGNAEAPIEATKPLVLRALLPAQVTDGDNFEATVLVRNRVQSERNVTLRAWVNDREVPVSAVRVGSEGSATVRIPVQARGLDPVRLRVEGAAEGETDRAETIATVQPRGYREQSLVVGGLDAGERTIPVQLPAGAIEPSAHFDLSVAVHPFVGFDAAVETLATGSYDGAEAFAAEILACASAARLRAALGSTAGTAELRARAERAIRSLASRQSGTGAFSRWDAWDQTEAGATSFALRALGAAKALGWSVPEGVIERARTAINPSPSRDDAGAAVLQALAATGTADAGAIDALYEQRDALSAVGLARLALALAPTDRRRDALLLSAVRRREGSAPNAAMSAWSENEVGEVASMLEAAARIDVGTASLRGLATRLLALRDPSREGWITPRETALSLAALAAYADRFRSAGAPTLQVTLDGAPINPTAAGVDGQRFTLPASVATGAHQLRVRSDRTVFFALRGRWAQSLSDNERVPRSTGISVYRVLETEQGRRLDEGSTVRVGDRVRVRLFVYGDDGGAGQVRVRDRLAGGLEPIDLGLETGARGALTAMLGGEGEDEDMIDPRGFYALRAVDAVRARTFDEGSVLHELRTVHPGLQEVTYLARAVTPGHFTLAPAELRGAYDPAIRARSAVNTLRVER